MLILFYFLATTNIICSLQQSLPASVTTKRTLIGSSIQKPTENSLDWSFSGSEEVNAKLLHALILSALMEKNMPVTKRN